MKSYTDDNGRTWQLVISVFSARRVRDALGVDLLNIAPPPPAPGYEAVPSIFENLEDPATLVDVLFELCRSQVVSARLDAETFAAGLRGDVLPAALDALIDEIIDFFPSDRRTPLAALVARTRQVRQRRMQAQAALVAKALADPALDEVIEGAMRGGSPSTPPPSSASSRGPSRSAS